MPSETEGTRESKTAFILASKSLSSIDIQGINNNFSARVYYIQPTFCCNLTLMDASSAFAINDQQIPVV
jgi:hypothetical protein